MKDIEFIFFLQKTLILFMFIIYLFVQKVVNRKSRNLYLDICNIR